MEVVVELVKASVELLKVGTTSQLALIGLFIVVSFIAVVYFLSRQQSVKWMVLGISIWLVACLISISILSVYLLPDLDYIAKVVGQDTVVKGNKFELDLGNIVADKEYSVELGLKTAFSDQEVNVVEIEKPLDLNWLNQANKDHLSDGKYSNISLKLKSKGTDKKQSRVINIVPNSIIYKTPLTIIVKYIALPGEIEVRKDSGPKQSGRGQDFSDIYSVCLEAPKNGDYRVVKKSIRYWLTGDRACHSWARCPEPVVSQEGKKVCFNFSLQGHNECLQPWRKCNPVRNSEGHISAKFKLNVPNPKLTVPQN